MSLYIPPLISLKGSLIH